MSVLLFKENILPELKNRFRHELKYLVKINETTQFFEDLLVYCDYDKHAGKTHSYEIASTYYDTPDLRFYYDREESVGYRRKVRLRTYNTGSKATALFIEIKEKHKQFVSKKRLVLKDMSILENGIAHNKIPLELVLDQLEDSAESRELKYLNERLLLEPVLITRYVRKAVVPKHEHDMRITLDTRITAGGDSLPVYNALGEKLLIDPDHGVLEIKSNVGIPLWLHSIMHRYEFVQSRYSKYCLGVDALFQKGKMWFPEVN